MKLSILTPTESIIENDVRKIIAEGEKGYFCLLPRHIDFISTLVPGILVIESINDNPVYTAIDEGILVKKGDGVSVSVRNAFRGTGLDSLKKIVEIVAENYKRLDSSEKKAREIIAGLEAGLTKLILEIK